MRRLAIVCISGFLQDGSARHGVLDLVERVGAHARGNQVQVYYRTWRTCWRSFARELYHRGVTEALLAGYSYGGQAAAILSGHLNTEGIRVPLAILSDPVHRWRGLLRVLNWRNLAPRHWLVARPPIVLRGVRKAIVFYQREDLPCGDDVQVEGDGLVLSRQVFDRGHAAMDNLPTWHDLVAAWGAKLAENLGTAEGQARA